MKTVRFKTISVSDEVHQLIIVSDLHGFAEALAVIDDRLASCTAPFQVIAAGDYVATGLRPVETLEWIRDRAGELAVLGNHDIRCIEADAAPDAPAYTEAGSWARLDSGLRSYLKDLPHILDVSWGDKLIRVMHETAPSGAMFEWTASVRDVVALVADRAVDLTVCGHTHYAFVHQIPDTIVANAGSVCAPILGYVRTDGSVAHRTHENSSVRPASIPGTYLSVTRENDDLDVRIERFRYDAGASLRRLEELRHPKIDIIKQWFATGVAEF